GYDRTTKSCIGYLGRQGYSATLPDEGARFVVAADLLSQGWAMAGKSSTSGSGSDHPDHSPLYLLSAGKVFRIQLEDRTVHPLDISAKVASIGIQTEYETRGGENGSVAAVAARPVFRTADEILFWQRSDAEQPPPPLVIPASLREHGLTIYRVRDGQQVLTSGIPGKPGVLVAWADTAGTVTREETIQLGGHRPAATSASDYWMTAVMGPSTLWVALAEFVFTAPANDAITGKPLDRSERIRQTLAVGWAPLVAVTLLSTALALWVYRRQRRLREPGAAAWSGLVFVFGIFGWAAYLLHRNWPARERCPQCGQEVPRNHTACVACRAPFAPPSPLGIELYA
ncbi:MAG: hypothetical protein JNG90_05725, partial [Planctomycetaceae bacterium]|nr:hypothetical protein [Planctomycetaceae bacterium]